MMDVTRHDHRGREASIMDNGVSGWDAWCIAVSEFSRGPCHLSVSQFYVRPNNIVNVGPKWATFGGEVLILMRFPPHFSQPIHIGVMEPEYGVVGRGGRVGDRSDLALKIHAPDIHVTLTMQAR